MPDMCVVMHDNPMMVTAELAVLQLHTSESSEAGCNAEGKLQIGQQDLLSIFITSTAEMPGMVFSSLLVDFLGRKRYALSAHTPWVQSSVSC